MEMDGIKLYSNGSGVKSITVHLSGLSLSLLELVQVCKESRYGWSSSAALVWEL